MDLWVLTAVVAAGCLLHGAFWLKVYSIARGAGLLNEGKKMPNPKPPNKRAQKRIQLAADNLKQSLRFLISTEGLTPAQVRALVEISIAEIKAERGIANE